ncbi:MAG: HAMP domain-containing sensor histidine kinase [Actinoplanes sp.]
MRWRPGLRARLALISAAAVAVAIALVSVFAWFVTARTMQNQIDRTMITGLESARFQRLPGFDPEELCRLTQRLPTSFQQGVGSLQLVRADGSSCPLVPGEQVPVTAGDAAVAAGGSATGPRDATSSDGTHVRVAAVPLTRGYAVMMWRDLTELDNTLRTLALVLSLAGGLGALGALSAGLLVARAGLRPLDHLTGAAEHVAATQNLNVPIAVTGKDEVARLAGAFNKMTGALDAARQRHNQMIADASHELRTPLTSLRTNIELLVRSEDEARALDPADRRDLLHSLSAQVQELSQLAGELSLLAHHDPPVEAVGLRFDEVVQRAVDRASRRGRHPIEVDLQPWSLVGDPGALERAVLNVLDNAIKFSPPGSTVSVCLRGGLLEIADQGPGIPESARRQVFQRFWRSPEARSMPGSGLGLAIVADVVEGHGGQVGAGASRSGGAAVTIRLPGR